MGLHTQQTLPAAARSRGHRSTALAVRAPRWLAREDWPATNSLPAYSNARRNLDLICRYRDYLKVRNYSPATQTSRVRHALDFALFLRSQSICAVERVELLAYLTDLYDRGLAKSTVCEHIDAIRSLTRFIDRAGLPRSAALATLRRPKRPQRVGDFHPYEEIERLIAAAETPLERALLELGFATGCRASELARIRLEAIDWDERAIRVLGKGNKERVVFFGKPAEQALRDYLQGWDHGVLFANESRRRPPCERVTLNLVAKRRRPPVQEWHAFTMIRSRFRHVWLGPVSKTSHAAAEARLRSLVRRRQFERHIRLYLSRLGRSSRALHWRARWREYDGAGSCVIRYGYFGNKANVSRRQALARLRALLKGRSLTPPLNVTAEEHARPPGLWWRSRWTEYDRTHRGVRQCCWLGAQTDTTRGEAIAKLRALLRGKRIRPERQVRISAHRPDIRHAAAYWRAEWTQYDAAGHGTRRGCHLGNVANTTREQALTRLRAQLKGVRLTPPLRIFTREHIFRTRPLSVRGLRETIAGVGARVGIRTYPHKLRHSFATAMLNNGAGIREVQELLGHASIGTTARYLHLAIADLKATHRRCHPQEQMVERMKRAALIQYLAERRHAAAVAQVPGGTQ